MQTCGNTPLSLTFISDFSVSTKCKAIFAVASFRNSSGQFFKPAPCSNFKLSCSLDNICFYFSLLETVLRECITFLFFHRSCSGRRLFLNYDLFVESSRKMDIRQFLKRKSISDSRSTGNISDKVLRIEVQLLQTD